MNRPLTTPMVANPWDLYSSRRSWAVAIVLFLIASSASMDRAVIAVLMEPIKSEFHVSDTSLGLLTGLSFALFYVTLGIPVARWADRGNRKVIVLASLGVWTTMTILCGLAVNFSTLALARLGVGAGEAGSVSPAQSLLADYFSPNNRAKALGFFMLSPVIGGSIGLAVGGYIAMTWGWRAAFICVGLPGVVLGLLAYALLDEPRRRPAFAAAPAAAESAHEAFKALARKPAFVNLLAGMTLQQFTSTASLAFLISFVVRIHHVSLAQAGAMAGATGAFGAVVGTAVGGWLGDRLSSRDVGWAARLPAFGLMAAFPAYVIAFTAPDFTSMAVALTFGMAVMGLVIPPMYSAVHLICGSRRRGIAVASAAACTTLIGSGCGPVVAGFMSDQFSHHLGQNEGLRWAILAILPLFVPAGLLLLNSAKYFRSNVEA